MLMTIHDDLLAISDELRGYRVTLGAGQPEAPPDHRLKRAAAEERYGAFHRRPRFRACR
jgi:hypothetical protein